MATPIEVLDVPDEPQAQPMPEKQVRQQQQITDDHVVEQPDAPRQSKWFNSMKEQLAEVEKAVVIPSQQVKDKSPTPVATPDAQKIEPPKPDAEPTDEAKTFTSAKAADWKKLKDAITEQKNKAGEFEKKLLLKEKEVAEMQAKYALADRTPEFTKQLDELKAQRDKLQEQIEKIDLEKSEPFANHYQKQFDSSVAKAKDAVGTEHGERIEQLLQLKPSKWRKERLNEVRETLTGVDQGQLDIAIAEFDRARSEKESALANHKDSLQKVRDMDSLRRNRENELAEARIKDTIARVTEKAREFDAFKASENDAEHNAIVRQNEESISRFFKGELEPDQMAVMPILAAQAKHIMGKMVPSLQAEIAELKAALEAQKAAIVKPAGGQQQKPGAAGEPARRGSFTAGVMEQLNSIQR